MAERLHNQISGETQAGQIGKLIARHSSGGILRTDGGDLRLAVLSWSDPGNAAGSPHYFLRQRKAGGGGCRRFRPAENVGGRKVQRLPRSGRQAAANNQRNAPSGAHFIQQNVRFQGK